MLSADGFSNLLGAPIMFKIFTSSIVLLAIVVEPAFSQSEQAKRQAEQTQKQVELVLGIVQQMAKLYIESSLTKAARKEEQELRTREIAKLKERQIQEEKLRPFGGLLDVFYTVGGGGAQTPHLTGVRLIGYVELGGRSFARFSGDNETWMIDVARIVAIRVQSDRPETKKTGTEKKETK